MEELARCLTCNHFRRNHENDGKCAMKVICKCDLFVSTPTAICPNCKKPVPHDCEVLYPPGGQCSACWGKGNYSYFSSVERTVVHRDCPSCNGTGIAPERPTLADNVQLKVDVTSGPLGTLEMSGAMAPADTVESHTFLPGISTFPPSKQGEECEHCWKWLGGPSVNPGGDYYCHKCHTEVSAEEWLNRYSTPPKAEGVGELETKIADILAPLLEAVYDTEKTKPQVVAVIDKTLSDLIGVTTSAVRAAEERKDGEWRLKIGQMVDLSTELSEKEALIDAYKALLPPPPDEHRPLDRLYP